MSERLPEGSVLRIVLQSQNILELQEGKKDMLICLDSWTEKITMVVY